MADTPGAKPATGAGRSARPARLADVAREAGVSLALVSRILNQDSGVRAGRETRDKVLDAAERLQYVGNSSARHLRVRRSGVIGLVVHDLGSPIYLELLRGAQQVAAARGYHLMLGDADDLLADETRYREFLAGGRLDGLLIQAGHTGWQERLSEVARLLPTVIVNAPGLPGTDEGPAIPGVYVADDEAAAAAARHLVALGHTEIGYLGGPRGSATERLRRTGVRRALAEAGLSLPAGRIRATRWDAASGARAMRALLGTEQPPTGVVAGNLLVATGALRAAGEVGTKVPEEVSVAAVHDGWFAQYTSPSLTTVRLPLDDMGGAAVDVLLTVIAGRPSEDLLVDAVPPRLLVRESTAPPPAGEPDPVLPGHAVVEQGSADEPASSPRAAGQADPL